jgi:membrane associated rhomboid family serine protease
VASGPDLFVVCKHCGAEVSPYITECPYCGKRILKRAPKLDRDGGIAEKTRRRPPSPSLPRLRRGEIPGIRHDSHPYGTILLVALAFAGTLLWRTSIVNYGQIVAYGNLTPHWWKVFTSPFVYDNTGYAVITVGVIALFGTLFERRHGPFLLVALFLLGGAAGTALAIETSHGIVDGANGAALALITAWAIPDLLELIGGEEPDGDIIGVGVLAVVIALMPLVAPNEASWLADAVGVGAGVLIGYPVARLHPV